jgi:hypothetical protein
MPGMVDTTHSVFLFPSAEYVGEPTDTEEAGHVEWVPLADVASQIREGRVAGSGSLVGLLYLLALRGGKR